MTKVYAASVYYGHNKREHLFANSEQELAEMIQKHVDRLSDLAGIFCLLTFAQIITWMIISQVFIPGHQAASVLIMGTFLVSALRPGYINIISRESAWNTELKAREGQKQLVLSSW